MIVVTRKRAVGLAQKLGVAVLVDRGSVGVLAPPGSVFAATQTRLIRVPCSVWGKTQQRSGVYDSVVGDLALGLEPCVCEAENKGDKGRNDR